MATTITGSARDRLLAAADELFYSEGIHTVGIDRIIEHAGVAKASLYATFGSKDELVRAYLELRHDRRRERYTRELAERWTSAAERLVGVFELMAEWAAEESFRGCAFYAASAESPRGGVVEQVSDVSRAWTRQLFTDLATEAGASDPAALASRLVVIYDGGVIGTRMDRTPAQARVAHDLAAVVVGAALAG